MEVAKRDFRDVVAPAEYPCYAKHQLRALEHSQRDDQGEFLPPGKKRNLRFQELLHDGEQQIFEADWRQYQKWLTGT
jgi:hypothetical protein